MDGKKVVVQNPYSIAEAQGRRRAVKAGLYSLFWALIAGFAYAQLARGAGLPSGLIGATAIFAQVLTYGCALALQMGKFWR